MPVKYHCGDICRSSADAIVNAANSGLWAGSGVCGAIFAAARKVGKDATLADECAKRAPCPTGDAVWTNAYGVSGKYIIHAVGPIWNGSKRISDDLSPQEIIQLRQLSATYISVFSVAGQLGVTSVAIPSISTGIYGLPAEFGAAIANDICSRYASQFDIELWGYSQDSVDILKHAPTDHVVELFTKKGLFP